ncbi:hypothetical protein RHECNPAF_750029 [Rhizobium etli CNPAF512]|nr:hypothetical protein RHECNPAF_750029 [Rhizobium etli CNPAF512]
MFAALLGVRQDEAMGAMHDPAMHHHPGELGVELQAPGVAVVAESLVRIGIAFGQKVGAARQLETLAVEMIDHLRPVHQQPALLGRVQWIPADLGRAVGIRLHLAAKVMHQHLGTEADAEIGAFLPQRNLDPVDLLLDEFIRIIGAHRPAEDDGAGMIFERCRKRFAEHRSADVEAIALFDEQLTDAAGARSLLMQDDEDRPLVAVLNSLSRNHLAKPGHPSPWRRPPAVSGCARALKRRADRRYARSHDPPSRCVRHRHRRYPRGCRSAPDVARCSGGASGRR